jgi:ureidoacrylate peracid hydrolase
MGSEEIKVFASTQFDLEVEAAALVVVDMQNEFLRQGGAVYVPGAGECIANNQRLIQACRQKGLPIFFTKYVTPPVPTLWREFAGSLTEPPLLGLVKGRKRFFPDVGRELAVTGIIEELEVRDEDTVVEKSWYDSFWASPLESYLRAVKARDLIVTGVVTEVCVEATVKAAYLRNFRTVVAADAVASAEPEYHRVVLELLARRWAMVLETEEIVDRINL